MSKKLLFVLFAIRQTMSVTVVTFKGAVVGNLAKNGNYFAYLGVPYAQVNESSPFEDTTEYPTFEVPFNATNPYIKCPQIITSVSGILQCLRLNIYVPVVAATVSRDLPVLVWFHGGGLAFGSAGEYNATHLVQQGILVVTANYRLGPYGFLCTSEIKNQGLKDQKAALKWVKTNIRSFGGDPDRVTVGGESWAASTVDFLLYEDGDFSQAIMQSGSMFSFGVSTKKDNQAPIKIAARLGHYTKNYKNAIKFLGTVDPVDVLKVTAELRYVFGVCVWSEKPGDYRFKQKYSRKIKRTPILIGYNSKESFTDFAKKTADAYDNVESEFLNNLYMTFDLPSDFLNNLAVIIWKFYLGEKNITQEYMVQIVDLWSDLKVNYGVERSVTSYLRLGNPKVYKYLFSYTGGSPFNKMPGVGAYHTEELIYLFDWGIPLISEEERYIRKLLVTLWSNFIKFGDPTPGYGRRSWVPTNLVSRPYLNINVESEMMYNVYHQRMAFWELIWTAYEQYV